MAAAPRSRSERKRDALGLLASEIDCWVATADPGTSSPYLVPLSFLWRDGTALLSTRASNPTGRNLLATGEARLGVGRTRDVVLVEGRVEVIEREDLPADLGDAFAEHTGFDPRTLRARYLYFLLRPRRIQVWREENELADRDLLVDGRWLV